MAERDGYKKDAERLDYLQEHYFRASPRKVCGGTLYWNGWNGLNIREAIDQDGDHLTIDDALRAELKKVRSAYKDGRGKNATKTPPADQ